MGKILESIEKGIVKHRRKYLARRVFARHQGVIQRGTFKGMTLDGVANISQAAHGLKIFGLYEAPVLDKILSWMPSKILIDIGAGDGYYPVGLLHAKKIDRGICFEAADSGRAAIEKNASLNGVGGGIEILGKADEDFTQQIKSLQVSPKDTVLLCDIEGAEFDIFSKELLETLEGANFIIELHDKLLSAPPGQLREKLEKLFPKSYQTTIIRDTPRPWNGISELEEMADLDRALITSEGRKIIGEWLVAEYVG